MSTTKKKIVEWLDEGVVSDSTHMLVVCDEFDWSEYPVFISPSENAREVATTKYGYPGTKNMQRVVEVYSLRKNLQQQLDEYRAFWFD